MGAGWGRSQPEALRRRLDFPGYFFLGENQGPGREGALSSDQLGFFHGFFQHHLTSSKPYGTIVFLFGPCKRKEDSGKLSHGEKKESC